MIYDYEKVCNSCTIYIVLLVISNTYSKYIKYSTFIYFHWYLKRDNNYVNTNSETVIY